MATPVALQAPCIVIYSGILSAGNSSIGTLFSNQGVGQIWVATMGHFSVAISTLTSFGVSPFSPRYQLPSSFSLVLVLVLYLLSVTYLYL